MGFLVENDFQPLTRKAGSKGHFHFSKGIYKLLKSKHEILTILPSQWLLFMFFKFLNLVFVCFQAIIVGRSSSL